jgi:hypothetical protein
MAQLIGDKRFTGFARWAQNGFVGLTVCFMTVSRQAAVVAKPQAAKRTFDSSMTSHA